MNYHEEEWRDIEGFEGYQISSEGRVRSFWHRPARGRGARRYVIPNLPPHIVPQSDDGNGYLKVCLMRDGKTYMRKVHALVAKAFIFNPDPEHLTTVDHIQSGPLGKLNNRATNLQWMSRGDNIRKAWVDGCCSNVVRRGSRPLQVALVDTGETMIFPSITSAASWFGFNLDTLRHYLRRYDECLVNDSFGRSFCISYADWQEANFVLEDGVPYGGYLSYEGLIRD